MKRTHPITKVMLAILMLSFLQIHVRAQSLGISVSNATTCVPSVSNQVVCTITSTLAGTSLYSYTVSQNCGTGTSYAYGVFGSTTATLNVPCAGPYTVSCNAINSSSVVIANAMATGSFNAAPTVSISISPNGGAGCVGTSFTVNLSGASSFTTLSQYGTFAGNSVVITPTSSSCFTVSGSNGLCTANATRCFTIYSPSSVSLPSNINVCSGVNYTLNPSGATSYTWSTGSTLPFLVISPTVSTCYTVSGTNPYCSGTSTAVTCVSVNPVPAINFSSSSNSICLGSSFSLTASGATTYTWAVSATSLATNYFYTNMAVLTPTVAGNYIAQLTAANSGICSAFGTLTVSVAAPASVNVPSTYTLCSGSGNVTLFASGANNYTWSTGANTNSITVSPTVATCYTVSGSNNICPNISTAVTCVNIVAPAPPIVVSGPTVICNNSSNTFTATGGNGTYNWFNAITYASYGTGSVKTIPSSTNTSACFVVSSGGTITSCSAPNVTICPSVMPSPTVTINATGNNTICLGDTYTLSGNGANTYTWNTGSSLSSILINPTSSQCYSVIGTGTNGCTGSAVNCYSVLPVPNVVISGLSSACPGSNVIYTAVGAAAYNWSNSGSSNTTAVNSNVAGCYTVTGYNAFGCNATVTKCYTPLATPTISIAGNNTVCVGSSATFTASGGTTYTWNSSSNTNTFYVLPSSSSVISVSANHLANNCTSSTTFAVIVNTACAIVWPGDANRDGVVSSSDVFELGLAANATGAARSGASISWNGQYATAWTGNVSTGWNKAHADCNGDGTINAADTAAINANFSSTHAFKNNNNTSGIDLFLMPQKSEVYGGLWNVVDIVLGDVSNAQSQLYGAAFDLDFDQNMLYSDSVKLVYTGSYLNGNNQNIQFGKKYFANGKLYAASVRTDHNAVSGNGKIAEIWFKLRNDLPDNSTFVFGINNGLRTDASGNMAVLNTSGSMNLNLNNNATGVKLNKALNNLVNFYPNPANQSLIIKSNLSEKTNFRLFDVTGRCVMTGDVIGVKTIDISSLQQGVYVFEYDTNNGKIQKKLIKE